MNQMNHKPDAGRGWLRLLMLGLVMLLPATLHAGSMDDIQRFFASVQSYSAGFDQVVLDENHNILETSSGEFWIDRPGRFRWHYTQPSEQLLVSNGDDIWIYDVELEQVTHRRAAAAVGETPATLLAGKGDLETGFDLEDLGRQGKLDWVRMLPKKKDSGYLDIRVGFEDGQLRLLEMIDTFEQTTRMRFLDVRENEPIDRARFEFTPPPGVDVIEDAR